MTASPSQYEQGEKMAKKSNLEGQLKELEELHKKGVSATTTSRLVAPHC